MSALAFPGCCEDDLFAKTNCWRFLKKRWEVKKLNAIEVSFSICTTTSSIRQLLDYFILSSHMQDTAPPSSSFTHLLPNLKTPLTIGQYLQQKAHGRKYHALLSLPNTTTATITFNCSFWILHNCKKQSPRAMTLPQQSVGLKGKLELQLRKRRAKQDLLPLLWEGSITVLVRGSNCSFENTTVHMASRLTGFVCFYY